MNLYTKNKDDKYNENNYESFTQLHITRKLSKKFLYVNTRLYIIKGLISKCLCMEITTVDSQQINHENCLL